MSVPRIIDVKTAPPMSIYVTFENGDVKELDMRQYADEFEQFRELKNPNVFRRAHADIGGMGIVWTDRLDLSRYDVWEMGIECSNKSP